MPPQTLTIHLPERASSQHAGVHADSGGPHPNLRHLTLSKESSVSFAAAFLALLTGHHGGDRWAQSDHQATHKGGAGWAGRRACASHAATLTLCQMVALGLVAVAEGGAPALQVALGLGVNAASRYWIDRRHTLEGLALALGRGGYYRRDAQAMDQAAHMAFLLPAALIITAPTAAAALLLAGVSMAVLVGLDQLSRLGRSSTRQSDGLYVVMRNN